MQRLPIEYFVADVVQYHSALKWIEFRGGKPWLRMSEPTCGFTLCLASDDFEIDIQAIQFYDKLGQRIVAKITSLPTAPSGLPSFETHPPSQKAILQIELELGADTHAPYPITLYMPVEESGHLKAIFSIQPTVYYPDFLFEAVHNYGPAVAPQFTNFVETGSLYGHTSIHASYLFEKVFTIELSDHLYNCLKPVEAARPNLKVFKGNSKDVLPEIIQSLSGPTVFFLDAHWSGDNSIDWSKGRFQGYPTDTAHSGANQNPEPAEQKPIVSEYTQIFDTFLDAALLIIDDWELVGKTEDVFEKFDWSHISKGALMQYFADSSRTIFHHRLGTGRYVVGLKSIAETAGPI